MPTYILLGNFTDQGIRNARDIPKRAEAAKTMAKKAGVTVKDTFYTLGAFDFVSILDAPDEASLTAFGLGIGALGNVRTQTLRAFSTAEMQTILGKLP